MIVNSIGKRARWAGIVAALVLVCSVAFVAADQDFGQQVHADLNDNSQELFGVGHGLDASSTTSIDAATASADPSKLATFAEGLNVRVITSGVAAPNLDMIALWPNDQNPQWIIECNEEGPEQAGLQRIRIADGLVETILTGTSSCDPTHRTAWGTILFGEEAGGGAEGGRVYELIDPLHTTGVTLDRTTGVFSGGVGAENFAARPALGRLSFEGVAIYPNGVIYYSDENRPLEGAAGGAYFKFIPRTPRGDNDGAILTIYQSPLESGSVYGLRLGPRSGNTDYGQGSNTGLGIWVAIPAATDPDLRAQSAELGLTGYYRPEDMSIDEAAQAAGNVRLCANNTGNEFSGHNWGETICLTDGALERGSRQRGRAGSPVLPVGHARAPDGRQHRLPAGPRQLGVARGRRCGGHRQEQ